MEVKNKWIIISAILLILLTFYTLYNINYFMDKKDKCEPAFEVINKCHCIPDKYIAELFNTEYSSEKLNLTSDILV